MKQGDSPKQTRTISGINKAPVHDTCICIIKNAGQMASVEGMYEHVRGILKHKNILQLIQKKHTYLF